MRISDWSSDVCSSDLHDQPLQSPVAQCAVGILHVALVGVCTQGGGVDDPAAKDGSATIDLDLPTLAAGCPDAGDAPTPLQCCGLHPPSEERRVGQEGVGTCRSRGSPYQ